MPVTLNAIYELKLWSHLDNQLGLNVLHYRVSALGTPPPEANVAAAFEGAYAPVLKPCMALAAAFMGATIQQIHPLKGRVVPSTAAAGAGGSNSNALPKQIAGIISKYTDMGGRANIGRMYVPFPTETQCENEGKPTEAYLDLLEALAVVMISTQTGGSFGGGTFTPVILHRGTPPTTNDITEYRVRAKFATQRRRGDFGRVNPSIVGS